MNAEGSWRIFTAPQDVALGPGVLAHPWTDITPFLRPTYPNPREELRDRLNGRLQGKEQCLPLNWRGLR